MSVYKFSTKLNFVLIYGTLSHIHFLHFNVIAGSNMKVQILVLFDCTCAQQSDTATFSPKHIQGSSHPNIFFVCFVVFKANFILLKRILTHDWNKIFAVFFGTLRVILSAILFLLDLEFVDRWHEFQQVLLLFFFSSILHLVHLFCHVLSLVAFCTSKWLIL